MALSTLLAACMALSLIAIIHAVYTLRKHKRTRKPSLPPPPGPVGLPLIGTALHFVGPFAGHSPHRVLAGLAKTYGHILSFRPGMAGNFVVVSSPAAARESLIGSDAAVAGRFVPDAARALAHCSESVFFLPTSDRLWKQHRATVGGHLSSGRSLDITRPIRDRHCRRLAEHLMACSGRPVKVGEAVLCTVLNVVSNIIFSEDVAEKRVMQQEGQMFKDLMVEVLRDWTRPNVSDAFPFLAPLDLVGSRRRVARGLAEMYKFFDEEFIDRRLRSGRENRHGDLLDVVLGRQHAKSELTRSQITKLFTDIFLAASNTSRITVEWTMALLLRHPDKMNKVRAELAANLHQFKEFVEESDLEKLPYLHAVVKETLRLHPPAPLLPRMVVAADGMSLGGFGVPAGTYVLVNLWAIGRDPAVWPRPEEFLPERFVVDFRGGGGSSDFAFKPFGAGRRVCPGMDFAARLVPLLLASMLHGIEWRLPGGLGRHEDVDLRDGYSMVLELATPLFAVPLAR